MIRNVLSHTNGVALYGILAVLLFFLTFAGMLVWALTRKRSLMKELGALPLADDEIRPTPPGVTPHEDKQ